MESHTKKSTRIMIWIIAIIMAGGFILSYFLVILQNEDASNSNTTELTQNQTNDEQETTVDPTAYKVDGKVETLQTMDLTPGTGAEVKEGDTITVHYKGTIAQTGVKFDSSYDRGEPITFELSGVIEGWQKGMPGMKEGGKRRLIIPASMAYGAQEQQGIPANSDLVFEVELLSVTPKQ